VATVAELLKTARLPERTVPICLRGDLIADMQDLIEQLGRARNTTGPDDRLGAPAGGVAALDLEARLHELDEQMKAATHPFRFRALSGDEFDALTLQHPVGNDASDLDKQLGYDYEAFSTALVRVSLVDPVVTSDDEFAELRAALNRKQWSALVDAAYAVSNEDVTAPFFRAASPATPASPVASA
jgi:hypothetical protein